MTHKKQNCDSSLINSDTVVTDYKKYLYRKIILVVASVLFLIIIAGIGMGVGKYSISFIDVYSEIISRLLHWGPLETTDAGVIWNLRMPRMLTAIIAGVGLSVAGAAMQSMLKNPLADPFTTGISSGACLGATLSITLGLSLIEGFYGTVLNAFILSLVPVTVIILLSKYKKATPSMMILAGISLMFIFDALTTYLMLTANPNSLAAAYEWTVGTLNKSSWDNLPVMFVTVLMGSIVLQYLSRYLNAMNSGDTVAKSLGVHVDRMRILILVTISTVAAGVVSFTGVIGFIGLISPHIARIFIGSDNKYLIPASASIGASLMVFADIVAKSTTSSTLPIGIITAMIGGPLFLILILRQKKDLW
jgi:iron complex transport system permease protein